MANYQEGQNAMSLDNRQNIVISRLNSLNEAVTKARTDAAPERVAAPSARQSTADHAGARHDFPVVAQNPTIQDRKQQHRRAAASRRPSCRSATAERIPRCQKINAQIADAQRRLQIGNDQGACSRSGTNTSGAAEEQTWRLARGAEASGDGPRTARASATASSSAKPKSNRSVYERAAAAGEGAARRQQQPREQRAA